MARVTKDPEERKNEILDMAQELFIEKGVEQTSVSEIVKKVGVAQGLFYYYFKSKEELVNAIMERYIDKFREEIEKVTGDESIDAITKIRMVFNGVFNFHRGKGKVISYFYDDKNASYAFKMLMKLIDEFVTILVRVIEEGIRQGKFDTEYPVESVEAIFMGIGYVLDTAAISKDEEIFLEKLRASEYIIKRILGIKDNKFSLL